MTLVIGLDTGGTFTDAALLDTGAGAVIGTGKSLTTRQDLSIGVGGAIDRVARGAKVVANSTRAVVSSLSQAATMSSAVVVNGGDHTRPLRALKGSSDHLHDFPKVAQWLQTAHNTS